MASSSSIANLFSLFRHSNPPPLPTTTKLPPSKPTQTTLSTTSLSSSSSSSSSSSTLVPLVPSVDKNPASHYSNDVLSVVCPSLAYANTLFFRSAYNVQVIVDDNEPEERLLNRFRREVMRAGVIQESKRRRFFENKQEEKKRKHREAAKRNRKRRPMSRNFTPDRPLETSKGKREDEEKDNWDLPEGELPY